jgi:hypothetical protein
MDYLLIVEDYNGVSPQCPYQTTKIDSRMSVFGQISVTLRNASQSPVVVRVYS